MTRRLEDGIPEAPLGLGFWVRKNGEWVEWVFGTEMSLSPQVVIPEVGTPVFQTFVDHVTTVRGGLYLISPFIALTGSSQNTRAEARITVTSAGVTAADVSDGGSYAPDGVGLTATQASTTGLGAGAEFTVTVSGGAVTSVDSVVSAGLGYAVGDTITIAVAGEIVAAVLLVTGIVSPVYQTLLLDTTFPSAGDVAPLLGLIPVGLPPGPIAEIPSGTYSVRTEFRQLVSPGLVTALLGGTVMWRIE